MTSQDLVDYINEHEVFQALKNDIRPEEIYKCGSLAQSEILRECELLEEYPTPTFVASQEIYTSVTPGWEFLLRAVRIKSGRHATSPYGIIDVRDKAYIDTLRYSLIDGANKPRPPKYAYHLLTNPLSVGFWGEPELATVVNLVVVRGHGSADNLSKTVNPLIPIGYTDLMNMGTIVKLIENRMTFEGTVTSRGKYVPDRWGAAFQFYNERFERRKIEAKITRTTVAAEFIGIGRMKMA